ncbi:branched-chain amino acid aminotransferase [Basidiobolus meristosporus CBS 931.73]|uniref:Branched-chain amino acid aminotransferase n=1 Tax=Basidiobolus meristosporus CBS 931.73 TaxID=1314790 RepID=A0A1Y1XM10_9FUNG|nr:branched-chain amino acid aminotransferase [Basidiobolus meristosporus CBS 931.73]|eukprot:ORX86787.1 branched-chain amino acid aminotransferase [Basidiobolus meristosporus CBS 931.73]
MTVEQNQPKDLDWVNLDFRYRPTNCHIKYTWRNGEWNKGELVAEPYVTIHIAATALHYGQECFEGMKAYQCKDGKVRIFRASANAERMQHSARAVSMQAPPVDVFIEAVEKVVKENREYVPPYGSGGSLYIRPILFGSGPQVGIRPAEEYTFIVFCVPVGDYYQGGVKPVPALVIDDFDRTAPQGVGSAKVGGNYAPCLISNIAAHDQGYAIILFLDSKTHTYVEEFATSNFLAITHDPDGEKCTLVTPDSPSILQSITRRTLCELAESFGWNVEVRPVAFKEVEENKFNEIVACGTAVVVTPIKSIVRGNKVIVTSEKEGLDVGFERLYRAIRGIQTGDIEDKFGWMTPKEGL